jgi:hypothetical protein
VWVLEALNRAVGQRQIEPDQLLIHTDQGSQYRAAAYRQLLEDHQISCSMSAKGCCWDNAVVESFFSTIKHELGLDDDAKTLLSPQQLIRELAFWIDGYYNRERRHSTIASHGRLQFACTRRLRPVRRSGRAAGAMGTRRLKKASRTPLLDLQLQRLSWPRRKLSYSLLR